MAHANDTTPKPRPEREGSGRIYAGRSAEERGASRREAMVDAGLELFGTRPYRDVSVADVVAVSGQTRRAFYQAFSNLEELLRAVERERVTDRVVERLAGYATGVNDWSTARALLHEMVAFYEEDPRRARVAFVTVVGVSDEMERHRRESFDVLADGLAQLAGAQFGPSPSERRLAALGFLGAMSELMTQRQRPDPVSRAAVTEELERVVRARFFSSA